MKATDSGSPIDNTDITLDEAIASLRRRRNLPEQFTSPALMPIVASIGGNTGNQTVALVIRALALSQLNRANVRFLLQKELAIGLVNGLMLGLLMAAATLVLYGSAPLAGVMLASMVLNMLLAAVVGVFCPLVLDRLGRDPVRGSSILLTATTDTMGFLIFLGLSTALLL